jgi:phosphoribosylamine--glycine ligase
VKVLVLGSGGREHALAWRLSHDPEVREVLCAPGNPGIGLVARCCPVDLKDLEDVLDLAAHEHVDLTVVGPEGPLERGIVDRFRGVGQPIVGPSQAAARLESSKSFAKAFMARQRIPTAGFEICESIDAAFDVVSDGRLGWPLVIKADGLAAGKGVVIAESRIDADRALRASMVDKHFGDAGKTVVLEQCLQGPEASFFVLTDGEQVLPIGTAEDHKRAGDDDVGPNTGGMGAFAPSPRLTSEVDAQVMNQIVRPVIDGMRAEGSPYAGFLYVGLMLTPEGPKVIEFNVRFGDPEAQVVLPLITGRFAHTLRSAATGDLDQGDIASSGKRAVGVVLASSGYPGIIETGHRIEGLDAAAAVPNATVFHAGTRRGDHGHLITAGGRVLTAVGTAETYAAAMETAYRAARAIRFEGMQFRRDIGRKALDMGE